MFVKKSNFELLDNYELNTFMVDTGIAKAISLLNKKNYSTWSSCQGHSNLGALQKGYIIFKKAYNFDTKPIGWKLDYINYEDRMRAILEMDYAYIDLYGLQELNKTLLSWVDSLEGLL